jgi:transposase
MYPTSEVERLREEFHGRVVADLKAGTLSYMGIAFKYGIAVNTVYHLARKYGCRRSEMIAKSAQAVQELADGQ